MTMFIHFFRLCPQGLTYRAEFEYIESGILNTALFKWFSVTVIHYWASVAALSKGNTCNTLISVELYHRSI